MIELLLVLGCPLAGALVMAFRGHRPAALGLNVVAGVAQNDDVED